MSEVAIRDILNQLRLPFTKQQLASLDSFVNLLHKWNQTYNLVGTHDTNEIITRHIADSLAVSEYLQGKRIIDVGSGAGLPGIPLAIMQPQKQFVLLDANGKKIRFIQQVIAELGLHNITTVHERAENFCTTPSFDLVLTRAFANIYDMLKVTKHLAKVEGCFLAMKGMQPVEELQSLPAEFRVDVVHVLDVPHLKAARCLIVIKHNDDEN